MSHAGQRTAFVFAGGGTLGAVQVGMLRELMHAGVSAEPSLQMWKLLRAASNALAVVDAIVLLEAEMIFPGPLDRAAAQPLHIHLEILQRRPDFGRQLAQAS